LKRNLGEIDNGNSIYKAITNDNKQIESPLVHHINLHKNWVFSLPHPKKKKINGISYDIGYGIETYKKLLQN